jgi:hypothetical protein
MQRTHIEVHSDSILSYINMIQCNVNIESYMKSYTLLRVAYRTVLSSAPHNKPKKGRCSIVYSTVRTLK